MVVGMHGGNVHQAARETGRSLRQLVDFSASINPLGPAPSVRRALKAALEQAAHYPDPDCVAIREALAEHFDLSAENLVVGNGSTELIHLLPGVLGIRYAAILGPTFSEYARAVTAAGGRVTVLNAKRAERYRPPVERAVEVIRSSRGHPDAVFVCNPNSPTGQAVWPEELYRLAKLAAQRDIRLIVDETFVEYCGTRSVLRWVTALSSLLVLRSFTKFYALPGFRVGYLAGASKLVDRIRERQPPWSVNTFAQCAALAALNDRRHARSSLEFMNRERPSLAHALGKLPGVVVYPSEANFLLVELPAVLPASVAAESLRRQGILIRDCSSVPGLTETTVRVAVRTRAQNRRLVAGLRSLLEETR
jgi:threonine-phosphate decarboxylase